MLALMLAGPRLANAEPMWSNCYGEDLRGSPTASGTPFDPAAYTAAVLGYAFSTVLAVTAFDTGATVRVLVNDRGPYVADHGLDLFCGAMAGLRLYPGVYAVEVQVAGYAD